MVLVPAHGGIEPVDAEAAVCVASVQTPARHAADKLCGAHAHFWNLEAQLGDDPGLGAPLRRLLLDEGARRALV